MSKHDFFHSTPHDIEIFLDGIEKSHKTEAKKIEYVAWLNGFYVKLAVVAALNGKKSKYPSQPLGEDSNNNKNSGHIVATEDMSEEEKERTRQLFLNNLLEMQKSFEGKGK